MAATKPARFSASALLGLLRSQCLLGELKLLGKFLAHDRHLGRRFDSNPYATMANFNHGHADLIADQNSFARFSTKYQHVLALIA
jgi:hypothetical protein